MLPARERRGSSSGEPHQPAGPKPAMETVAPGSSGTFGGGHSLPSEEDLLKISGATVHLVDKGETTYLTTGTFTLSRLLGRDGKSFSVLASVGNELQWPLAVDSPAGKLDQNRYLFSTGHMPPATEDVGKANRGDLPENIKYVVTFANNCAPSSLAELEKYLELYSSFSSTEVAPEITEREVDLDKELKQKGKGRLDWLGGLWTGKPSPPAKAAIIPETANASEVPAPSSSSAGKKHAEEEASAQRKNLELRAEDYSSGMAKGIASKLNFVIKGLLWIGDAIKGRIESCGDFAKAHIKTKEKPMKVSPFILRNLCRVKRTSRLMERVAKGLLAGAVAATGLVSGSLIGSRAGRRFFRMFPGQLVMISLDAFAKVFDAAEVTGKSVLITSRVVTCGVVSHRYGEQAGQAVYEGLSIGGHVLSTAWTIVKIGRALDPSKGGGKLSKKSLMKAALNG